MCEMESFSDIWFWFSEISNPYESYLYGSTHRITLHA